jgi:hypothetical protein
MLAVWAVTALAAVTALPAHASPTPEQKCAVAKNKAASKKLAGTLKCHQKAILQGTVAAPQCLAEAEAKFASAIQKADARGGCVTTGDAVIIEAGVDVCAMQFLALTPATTSTMTSTSTTSTTTTSTSTTSSTSTTTTSSTTTTTLLGPHVLIVGASSAAFLADVQAKLIATASFGLVDTFAALAGTPTAALLQQYQSVLVFSDSAFADSTMLGDRVADYFDGGGRVVVTTFANASVPLGGRWSTGGYHLINPTGQKQPAENAPLQILEAGSPLVAGVTSLTASAAYQSTGAVINGGIVVARWGDGSSPLVIRGVKSGRGYCALNFFPASSAVRADFWDGDGATLLRNCLLF